MSIRDIWTILVINRFAGDHNPVEEIVEQRCRRCFGDDAYGIFIDCGFARNRRNVLPLFAQGVGPNASNGVNNIICGKGDAVVKLDVAAQMEEPGLRIFDLPALHQQADGLVFIEIVSAETAEHLTPDAVHERDAVAIGIKRLHGLSDTDGNAGFGGVKPVVGRAENKQNDNEDQAAASVFCLHS